MPRSRLKTSDHDIAMTSARNYDSVASAAAFSHPTSPLLAGHRSPQLSSTSSPSPRTNTRRTPSSQRNARAHLKEDPDVLQPLYQEPYCRPVDNYEEAAMTSPAMSPSSENARSLGAVAPTFHILRKGKTQL